MQNYFVWNINPILFEAGPLAPRWYGLLFASGFALAYFLMRKVFRDEKQSEELLDPLLYATVIGTLIGARLGHTLFYDPNYYLSNPIKMLYIWEGGLASHGSGFGILAGLYVFTKFYSKKSYLWVVDRVAMIIPIVGCFVRIGNFMNSEILGKSTTVPWAIIFQRHNPIPRHPVQLYEAFGYFVLFWFLRAVYNKNKENTPDGLLAGLFLVLTFTFRFLIEYFKVPQSAFMYPISMGQILSIPVVLLGFVFLFIARKNAKKGA
ncbi:MAG: phosphatidylglycerol:prolipoprotein diacylglycerol transferase [bacterium]|jgi:phosphatidylglycerol:prolipoprotein diacylglycerol transferase